MSGHFYRKKWQDRFEELLSRLFPERQIHLRTEGQVRFITLGRRPQMVMVAGVAAVFAWTTFSTVNYVLSDRLLAGKDDQIINARIAYRGLLDEVSGYQKKFTAITLDLEENHGLMLGLVEQNAALQQGLKTAENKLSVTKGEREQVIADRERLDGELNSTKDELRSFSSLNFSLKDNLQSVEGDLQTALKERNEAQFEGTKLRRNLKVMETRLSGMETAELDAVQRLSSQASTFIENMERVVQQTGLKLKNLVKVAKKSRVAQGGPYIEVKPDALPASRLHADLQNLKNRLEYWGALQDVMRKIPLIAPLNTYRITSSYGKRLDPINGKWGAHYGLDLGGKLNTRVYTPAPGKVIAAGWKGKFGKYIEIDHGSGITTRYAHLNRIYVKRGQNVNFRDKIALLGNTGRSTGAHLHYEVAFKGRALNPSKFIKAGRYVFQE